jgi:hypothetical protein
MAAEISFSTEVSKDLASFLSKKHSNSLFKTEWCLKFKMAANTSEIFHVKSPNKYETLVALSSTLFRTFCRVKSAKFCTLKAQQNTFKQHFFFQYLKPRRG